MHSPRYWPALDGLRALAVLSVMLFHAHAPALPGGFLGVDVFFVISGFLIASQLYNEHQQTGHIRIRFFFARRLAKLQPALWGVLLFDLALNLLGLNPWYTPQWWQESLTVLMGLANWARAFNCQAQELMGHTWSLGLEEQFYVGWVIFWLTLQKLRISLTRQLGLVLLVALASALAMAWLHGQGASVSRLYNGTDARIQALLLGCALAVWRAQQSANHLLPSPASTKPPPVNSSPASPSVIAVRWPAGLWGLLALLTLVGAATHLNWQAPAMYAGGYTLLALLSLVVVATVTGPAPGLLGRLLSCGVLPHLGAVSYGLYIWHYPLYRMALHLAEVMAPGHPPTRVACLLCATALTWLMAEVSHHWLEKPLRNVVRIRIMNGKKKKTNNFKK